MVKKSKSKNGISKRQEDYVSLTVLQATEKKCVRSQYCHTYNCRHNSQLVYLFTVVAAMNFTVDNIQGGHFVTQFFNGMA